MNPATRRSSFRFDGEEDFSDGEISPKNLQESKHFASFRVVRRNMVVQGQVEDDEVECSTTPGAPLSPPRGPKGRAGPSAFGGHILEGISKGGHVEDMQTCSMGEPPRGLDLEESQPNSGSTSTDGHPLLWKPAVVNMSHGEQPSVKDQEEEEKEVESTLSRVSDMGELSVLFRQMLSRKNAEIGLLQRQRDKDGNGKQMCARCVTEVMQNHRSKDKHNNMQNEMLGVLEERIASLELSATQKLATTAMVAMIRRANRMKQPLMEIHREVKAVRGKLSVMKCIAKQQIEGFKVNMKAAQRQLEHCNSLWANSNSGLAQEPSKVVPQQVIGDKCSQPYMSENTRALLQKVAQSVDLTFTVGLEAILEKVLDALEAPKRNLIEQLDNVAPEAPVGILQHPGTAVAESKETENIATQTDYDESMLTAQRRIKELNQQVNALFLKNNALLTRPPLATTLLEHVVSIQSLLMESKACLTEAQTTTLKEAESMAKEVQKESVKVIFKNVVERIKEVRILRQQMQEPSDPECRVLKGHVYCHKCSKGPFPVNKTFNCDNCFTRLVRPLTSMSNISSPKMSVAPSDQNAAFFQRMEARRIRREEELAQARQRIAAKREQVYRHLESVLKSVAPLIAVGVPHSLPSASALSPPGHLEAQYYREGNTVMTYRKEDGKVAVERSQNPQQQMPRVVNVLQGQLPVFSPSVSPNIAVSSLRRTAGLSRSLEPLGAVRPLTSPRSLEQGKAPNTLLSSAEHREEGPSSPYIADVSRRCVERLGPLVVSRGNIKNRKHKKSPVLRSPLFRIMK